MFENLRATDSFKALLTCALEGHSLSHALIFEGSDEETRLAAAKEVAAYLLCKSENKPCGACEKCRKVQNGNHPDLHIISKDDKSAFIKVDAVRELKSKALLFPNEGEKSIFIINGAEHMNTQAQNALLKVFEEPAAHLVFILCCGTKSSLLDTVISRATLYSLGSTTESATAKSDKEQKAEDLAGQLLLSLVEENELGFMKHCAAFGKDKELFRLCLSEMKSILRDSMVYLSGTREMITASAETAKKLSSRFTAKKLLGLYESCRELYEKSMMNANHNLLITRLPALFYSAKA